MTYNITTVIFDVGNVLVRWDPIAMIETILPEHDPKSLYQKMRPIWLQLNLGELSEEEAIFEYQALLGIDEQRLRRLMHSFKTHQTAIPGSRELLDILKKRNMRLFAITDNLKEIIKYHQEHSDFLHYFEDVIVSADIHVLKPNAKIYKHLIDKYGLDPAKAVFFDDVDANVQGAKDVGLHAVQFTDSQTCKTQLIDLGVLYP